MGLAAFCGADGWAQMVCDFQDTESMKTRQGVLLPGENIRRKQVAALQRLPSSRFDHRARTIGVKRP